MLSGSSLSGWLDLEIEKEAEQGRPSDAAFYDNLFDDAPYSDFYLDLSFDFTGSSTNDYTVINTALYDALYSFYQDSDVNTTLVAVEHDMAFTLDALSFSYSGSVNRKLWFDNESDAISAQAFFAADIFDMYSTQSHSGWFQHNLLNNNLYKSSYNFSNVQSGINQVASTDPVDVPEPATWLLFLSAALLFMVGKARKHS